MASADQRIILVTGANSGVGLELASQLVVAEKDVHVLLGVRTKEKGQSTEAKLKELKPQGTFEPVILETSKDESIDGAVKYVQDKYGRLDSLVNNAGIGQAPGELSEQMKAVFAVNTVGPTVTTLKFLELLKKSKHTVRIVNVSSGLGSIAGRSSRKDSVMYKTSMIPYRASKAALNMVTADQAIMFAEHGFKVFSYCPGFRETNFSDFNKVENGAGHISEGVTPLVEVLNGRRDDQHGGFVNDSRGNYPW